MGSSSPVLTRPLTTHYGAETIMDEITIWRDMANMRTVVSTSQGVMFDEHGHPANLEATYNEPSRWSTLDQALQHFRRVDAILRSL